MAKKVKKTEKVGGERAARWTVRGVPARLQKAAGDAARARGQTLGQWLTGVVEAAIAAAPETPAETGWREAFEARLVELEAAMARRNGDAAPAARERVRAADKQAPASA